MISMKGFSAAAGLFFGCAATAVAEAPNVVATSPSLIVLPGATDVQFHEVGGSPQVSYELSERYPAQTVIAALSGQLVAAGWRPMADSFLNPGTPTSHVRGWMDFLDHTGDQLVRTDQWWGDWEHPDGSIITYVLRYAYPEGSSLDRDHLVVHGILTSAEHVEAWRLLQPLMEAELDAQSRMEKVQARERAELIRESSTTSGFITVRLIESRRRELTEESGYREWNETVVDDETVKPVRLEVVFAQPVDEYGEHAVELVLSEESAAVFGGFTRAHLGEQLAVFVGEELVSTPALKSEVTDIMVIEGGFSAEHAQHIAELIVGRSQ